TFSFHRQRKTKPEREEKILRVMSIENTSVATASFPGCALLWKRFGAHFALVSELSPAIPVNSNPIPQNFASL
ncbi:MAG: hypothetical protein NXI00_23010, partial [Cytophagales bacterium]|nr:hypothetical protein [Cytophagales bacterium]